jgi:YidC/Oxa1 family membrane protein insertase
MYFKRIFFIFISVTISLFLWNLWKRHNSYVLHVNKPIIQNDSNYVSSLRNESFKNKIIIKTNVLRILINKNTGNVQVADLLKYKNKQNSIENFQLLKNFPKFIYHIKSGLIEENFNYKKKLFLKYYTKKKKYELLPKHNTLIFSMYSVKSNGMKYKKIFIFRKGKYNIELKYHINNFGEEKLRTNFFGELLQTIDLKKMPYQVNNSSSSSRGIAYSSDDTKYKFSSLDNKSFFHKKIKNGWIAMLEKYFATAWVPQKNIGKNFIYNKNINSDISVIGYWTPQIIFQKNIIRNFSSTMWIGPEIQKEMSFIAPNLDLTVNYGFLWFLSQPLFNILTFFYKIIGNWGFAIIFMTIFIRLIMYPITQSQYISMIRLKKIQPKLDDFKKIYKNNKQKMNQKIVNLYKQNNISPFSGLLSLIIQMPIFLSFYYTLTNAIELRNAPFIFWIHDLSSYDQYYILPILMGITVLITQKISLQKSMYEIFSGCIQEKLMFFVPIFFIIFFLWFPSGLVLYYIISNIISIIQQKYVHNVFRKNKLI